ncbi:hypothetical protein EON80_07620 [bacterium]|nr:MAG: hypothetical protein EON80_07620 [bacterium]
MKKTFFLLPLVMSLAPAAWAAPTVISGTALDGSQNSQPLADATVQLVRPKDKGVNEVVAKARTNSLGKFSFPAKDYGGKDLLMAVINREGFDYISVAYDGGSTLKQVGIDVNPQKVDLLVFDTTTKPVPLDFQVHHLAIDSNPKGLHCIERIVIHNHSSQTFLGEGPRKVTIKLNVPKGAKNVKLDPKIGEGKLFQTADGWGFSKPVTPDSYGVSNALIFSYDVDWPTSGPKTVDLSHKTVYPTKFFFVARTTEDKGLKVTAPKLSADTEAPVPIDGQSQMRIVNSLGAPMMPDAEPTNALPAGAALDIKVAASLTPKVATPAAAPGTVADSGQPMLEYQAHHVAIKSTGTGLNCIERIVVLNHSDTTFTGVGKDKVTLFLDIPPGAKNLKMDPKIKGAKIVKTSDGWAISKPITPMSAGIREAVIFSYDLDWPSMLPWAKKVDLSHKTLYPTQFFFVARTEEDKGLEVTSPKLSPDSQAPVPIDGKDETRIINSIGAPMMGQTGAAPALAAGQQLDLTVSRPVSSTFWGFAGMTVALCLFLPLAMLKPRRSPEKSGSAGNFSEPPYGALVSEQTYTSGAPFSPQSGFGTDLALSSASRDLIQKIADLDDEREAGQIGEEEYQSRRSAWKKLLIESLGSQQDH